MAKRRSKLRPSIEPYSFGKDGIDKTSFFPFVLIDARSTASGDVRLSFDRWDWLEKHLGNTWRTGEELNGYTIEGLVLASRHNANLAPQQEGIDYNSASETCFVHFEDIDEAIKTARLAKAAISTPASALNMIQRGKKPLLKKAARPTSGKMSVKPMQRTQFWEIVAACLPAHDAIELVQSQQRLHHQLSRLSATEILAFAQTSENLFAMTYSPKLLAAESLIEGGVSDYSHRFFGLYLIANGKQRFWKAIRDADSLVTWAECADVKKHLMDIVAEAYQLKTKKEYPTDWTLAPPVDRDASPLEADTYYIHLPRLTQKLAPNMIPRKKVTAKCPSCKRKLRTELAKQCFHCGEDWH